MMINKTTIVNKYFYNNYNSNTIFKIQKTNYVIKIKDILAPCVMFV